MLPGEIDRLEALHSLRVLDSEPEAEFDALARAASLICGMPISLISLVDVARQWFKANVGLTGVSETPREVAFCHHAIEDDALFEIQDALLDPRFADNPLVVGDPKIRFYAGAPLRLRSGQRVGTLCVIDREPRVLNATQREALGNLAIAAARGLEGRRAMELMRQAMVDATRAALVLEHSADAIVGLSGEGRVVRWNPAAARLFGLAPGEILGALHSTLVPPSHRADSEAAFERLRGGEAQTYESARQRRDGTQIMVAVTLVPETDEAGERVGATEFVRDISVRERARRALVSSEARFRMLSDVAPIGLYHTNAAGDCVYTNQRWQEIFGLTMAESLAQGWAGSLHPEDRAAVFERWQIAADNHQNFAMEFRVQRPDGTVRLVRSKARAVLDALGEIAGHVGSVEDVTELRQMADKMAEQHEMLRVTLQSIGDAVITTDARGRVVWLNPVAERMTGWSTEQACGQPSAQIFRIINETTRETTADPVASCLAQGKVVGLASNTLLLSRLGDEMGVEDSAAPIRNERGEVLGAVLVFRDVTEQRRIAGEMSHRATHDALTGLVNRAEFEARLRQSLHRAQADRCQHSLLYVDLDQFKIVNDTCGHAVGDQLLQQVSRLLLGAVRTSDLVARLGGDEFAILLEHCTAEQAQRVAQKICDQMDEFRFLHDGRRFRLGTSIGLVPVDERWTTISALQQAADSSCYAAKEAGRNEQALDEDRFVLFAQHITPLHGAPEGLHAEVLLRMTDEGALIAPGAFLPAAERFHLASRIDRWVLRRTLAWMKAAPSLEALSTLCVNLSGQSVGDRAFHRWALALLADAGPAICARLCLEITETAAVTNLTDAALFVGQVRAVGVRVALDDFGAGASSFGYLKRLPVDVLKIDGQFIRTLVDDPLNEAAVRCFTEVARVVGLQTVAEFVDHPAVLARLRLLGVDFAQGFLLHRPSPIDDLLAASPGCDTLA